MNPWETLNMQGKVGNDEDGQHTANQDRGTQAPAVSRASVIIDRLIKNPMQIAKGRAFSSKYFAGGWEICTISPPAHSLL
jgi:hypothetical protein